MTLAEFTVGIERIEIERGGKDYGDAAVRQLHRRLEHVPAEAWYRAVEVLLDSHGQQGLPVRKDILEAVAFVHRPVRKRDVDGVAKRNPGCPCEDGLVFYRAADGNSRVGGCANLCAPGEVPFGAPLVDPYTAQVAEG